MIKLWEPRRCKIRSYKEIIKADNSSESKMNIIIIFIFDLIRRPATIERRQYYCVVFIILIIFTTISGITKVFINCKCAQVTLIKYNIIL